MDPNPYNSKWAADRNGKTQQEMQFQIEENYSSWICSDLQPNHPPITVRDGEDSTKVSLTNHHLFVTGSTIKPTTYGPIEFLQFDYTTIVNRPTGYIISAYPSGRGTAAPGSPIPGAELYYGNYLHYFFFT